MAPNINFVNVPNLNRVLGSEVFMSEDRQLKVVHLILDFKPLSDKFQDVGKVIRASDSRLARIDVSVPGFPTREGTVQVELPSHCFPHEERAPREGTTSSCLSLEEEIDQFRLEEEREEQGEPVIEVSDSKCKLDKSSGVGSTEFVVARRTGNLEEEEEEEEMPLERKKGAGLHELLTDRSKGSTSKDASGSQLPPPLSPPPPSASPFAHANLRKRKKDKEVKKGELVPSTEGGSL